MLDEKSALTSFLYPRRNGNLQYEMEWLFLLLDKKEAYKF